MAEGWCVYSDVYQTNKTLKSNQGKDKVSQIEMMSSLVHGYGIFYFFQFLSWLHDPAKCPPFVGVETANLQTAEQPASKNSVFCHCELDVSPAHFVNDLIGS